MLVLSASLALAPFVQNFDPIAPITKEVEGVSVTVTGDFDLVQARPFAAGQLTIAEQVGPFQFEENVVLALVVASERIEVADLDNDGDLDVVAANRTQGAFVFAENQGGGVYTLGASLNFAPEWRDFELSDVNGDGRLDVVGVASAFDSSFWFENVAAFSFNFRVLPNSAEPEARGLTKADFNGDGVDDFAITRGDGDVDVLVSDVSLGNVPYGSESVRVHRVLPQFSGLATADLDGDGDQEIIGSTRDEGIYVLEGVGFASFKMAEVLVAPVVNFFFSNSSASRLDVTFPNAFPTYVFQPGFAQLSRRAERFAVGRLSFFDDAVLVQEGSGSDFSPSALVFYTGASTSLVRRETLASGLGGLMTFGIHDLSGDNENDVLVASETVPRLAWVRSRRDGLAVRFL